MNARASNYTTDILNENDYMHAHFQGDINDVKRKSRDNVGTDMVKDY